MELLIVISIICLVITLLLKSFVVVSSLNNYLRFSRFLPKLGTPCNCRRNRVEPTEENPERVPHTASPSHIKHHLISTSTGFFTILLIVAIALTLLTFVQLSGVKLYRQTIYSLLNFLVMPVVSLLWLLKDENLRKFALSVIVPCR